MSAEGNGRIDVTKVLGYRPRIYVGLPNYAEQMDRRVWTNRIVLARHWDRLGLDWNFMTSGRVFIQFARSEFACDVIGKGFTHLLMLDDDAIVPVDFLEKLLVHDVDVVALPYVHRNPPQDMCVKVASDPEDLDTYTCLMDEDLDQGLVEVASIGTHAMLIKVDTFTLPGRPTPEVEAHNPFGLNDRASFAEDHNDGTPIFVMPRQGTEDTYFCARAIRKGFKVCCDTDQFAGHVGEPPVLGREHVQHRRVEDVA